MARSSCRVLSIIAHRSSVTKTSFRGRLPASVWLQDSSREIKCFGVLQKWSNRADPCRVSSAWIHFAPPYCVLVLSVRLDPLISPAAPLFFLIHRTSNSLLVLGAKYIPDRSYTRQIIANQSNSINLLSAQSRIRNRDQLALLPTMPDQTELGRKLSMSTHRPTDVPRERRFSTSKDPSGSGW